MITNLPNTKLIPNYTIAKLFLSYQVTSFHQACEYVWQLPYGRTSQNTQPLLVLKESKGTCSSKHALLKLLAEECSQYADNFSDIELVLGVYIMNEANSPGVGSVLSQYSLSTIPEAHCFLRYHGQEYDFTRHFYQQQTPTPTFIFIHRLVISPAEIGEKKNKIHKDFLQGHLNQFPLTKAWDIREECITAL